MNSKIKNIIFDWGGVLIDVTLDRFLAECKISSRMQGCRNQFRGQGNNQNP